MRAIHETNFEQPSTLPSALAYCACFTICNSCAWVAYNSDSDHSEQHLILTSECTHAVAPQQVAFPESSHPSSLSINSIDHSCLGVLHSLDDSSIVPILRSRFLLHIDCSQGLTHKVQGAHRRVVLFWSLNNGALVGLCSRANLVMRTSLEINTQVSHTRFIL